MQFRIGDRDPVTGLYDVIYPDGSHTRNGIKIFNSAHQSGDLVLATQRSDGMMILDSAKAVESVSGIGKLEGFGEQPIGYLRGQVWNNEEEKDNSKSFLEIKRIFRPIFYPVGLPLSSFEGFNIFESDSLITSSEILDTVGFEALFGFPAISLPLPLGTTYSSSDIFSGGFLRTASVKIDLSILPTKRYRYIAWVSREEISHAGATGTLNFSYPNDFAGLQIPYGQNSVSFGRLYSGTYVPGQLLAQSIERYNNAYHALVSDIGPGRLRNTTIIEGMKMVRIDYLNFNSTGYVITAPSAAPTTVLEEAILSIQGSSYVA
jgi:hypothetical protein